MYVVLVILTTWLITPVMADADPEAANQTVPVIENSALQAAKQAWPMIENGALLLDVRSAEEFAEDYIQGAINIEWDKTDDLIAAIGSSKQRMVVVYCGSGQRAGKAKAELEARGYSNIFNATGLEALKATKP
jgi:phage shock protein E